MKKIFRSHAKLATSLNRIVRELWSKENPSDSEKGAMHEFQEQAMDHENKARMFGDEFVAIRTQ